MAETEDAVMRILQNIQKDLADVKRGIARVESKVDANTTRMDAFEGYFTYTMGLTSRNQQDIKKLQSELRAIVERLDTLEPQP
jgi:uncharacterized coiled-coil protein SlyX